MVPPILLAPFRRRRDELDNSIGLLATYDYGSGPYNICPKLAQCKNYRQLNHDKPYTPRRRQDFLHLDLDDAEAIAIIGLRDDGRQITETFLADRRSARRQGCTATVSRPVPARPVPAIPNTPPTRRPVQRYNLKWNSALHKAIPKTPEHPKRPVIEENRSKTKNRTEAMNEAP